MDTNELAEIAFCAGLFEGEGCFTIAKRRDHEYIQWSINMTDREPLERFQRTMGGRLTGPYDKGDGFKPRWILQSSNRANVLRTGRLMSPWLCPRRLTRFAELELAQGANSESVRALRSIAATAQWQSRQREAVKPCSGGHCDRPVRTSGRCFMHWKAWVAAGKPRSVDYRRCHDRGCPKPPKTQGRCSAHYAQWVRAGQPMGWHNEDTSRSKQTPQIDTLG